MNNKMLKLRKIGTMVVAMMMVLTSVMALLPENVSAKEFTGKKGSVYYTHDAGQITYGPGNGGYSNTLKTTLNDNLGDRYSYCVQPHKRSVTPGKATIDKVVTDDTTDGASSKWNAMRNILYYSPSYPGYDNNIKGVKEKYYTGDYSKDWGIAHLALSWAYVNKNGSDLPTWSGTYASACGDVWTKAKALCNAMWNDGTKVDDAVPEGFTVFICEQNGEQDMMVGYLNTGKLKLIKKSDNPNLSDNNNCYDLAGATYEVKNESGKKVAELVTDEKGESETVELTAGTYYITETKAAKGYAIKVVDRETSKVEVEFDETTEYKTSDTPQNDPFAIVLKKADKETGKESELAGASLEGAEFEVKYYDAYFNKASDANGKKPLKTWTLKTDKNGRILIPRNDDEMKTYFVKGDEFEKSRTGMNTFALGSYIITETKAPEGYLVNGTPQLAVVKGDGSKTETVRTYNMLTDENDRVYEQVQRGDLEFLKKDIGEDRLANCVFKITSDTTGESHIVVTDPNGQFTSRGTVDPSTVNKNDEALNEDGTIDESKISYKYGVWFGKDKEGNVATPNAKLRPFPYDRYTITELSCKANENKSLIKTSFNMYKDGLEVDLGTLTDADIHTTLTGDKNGKWINESKNTVLTDKVQYEKLKTNKKYVAECTLMDRDTGKAIQVDGKDVTGKQEFTPKSNKGSVDVPITFDSTGMKGKHLVAFEEVYELKDDGSKGDLVATHKDLTDEGQTVRMYKADYYMYKVRTTDAPEANDPEGKFGFIKGEKVDYDVVVENRGDVDLTMNVSDHFNNKGYFSDPIVKKVTNATWNNKAKNQKVANITLKAGETAKVTFTTTVTNAPVKMADTKYDSDSKCEAETKDTAKDTEVSDTTKNDTAAASNDAVTGDETAEVTPDDSSKEENLKDCNQKDQTNKPVDDGWTNTAYTKDVHYTIEGEDKTLDDMTDIAQTPIRPNPKIGTYLTANGKKKVIASAKTKFKDTVAYSGLTPGHRYILECTLMVKDTKEAKVENGKPVTGTTSFVAKKSSGYAEVNFVVNTKGMEGKELVAFENCYNTKEVNGKPQKNKIVAVHKDINDKGQMVVISKKTTVPPLTGDDENLMIYGMFLLIGTAAGACYYKKRKAAGHKSNK